MLDRFRHYTMALLTLVAMAIGYRGVVDPWLQPPSVEAVKMAVLPVLRGDDSLADLFPAGAWQRGSCKRLQTTDGVLLFDRWEQTAGDQWKLWPVTVVIGRGLSGDSKAEPIIIESQEGAEIKFTQSLNVMSGGAPPISRGRIIGNVNIRRITAPRQSLESGQPTEAGGKVTPALNIRTANVGIDNRKIWTTEAIEMQLGDARLLGRDLTMYLSAATGVTPARADAGSILDRMELIYLDQLQLPLPSDVDGREPAVISVSCGGRVEYDFALDRLSLRDDVTVVHQTSNAEADRFDCQTIELSLRDPMNNALTRMGPLDWMIRLRATGTPAVANLPSYGIELAAEMIDIDAVAGLVLAEGGTGVRVRYGAVNARLARLGYQFDPKNPKRIGAVDAFGSGLVEMDDPSLPLRQVRWKDGFKMQPLGMITPDAIDADIALFVDGEVTAMLADGGQFNADSIEGVLKPNASPQSPTATGLRPDRFQALGNVRLDTAAIAVETERLMLYFVTSITHPTPQTLAAAETTGTVAVSEPAPSGLRQWVSQPDPTSGGIVAPIARPRPTVRGNSIKAELRSDASGISAKDLMVIGDVEVLHSIVAGTVPLEARLTGDRLQLQDGGGEDVLQLDSSPDKPARFELGDGYFVGPKIQIRPNDNIVWIDSAGEFRMPTAVLPTGLSQVEPTASPSAQVASSQTNRLVPLGSPRSGERAPPASKIVWTEAPLCRWQGEMIFDGRSAILTEGVDITASLVNGDEPWQLALRGDRLEVILAQDVEVRDVQTIRNAAVQQVVLMQKSNDQPVIAEAYQRSPDGALQARHLMSAPRLTLMPASGGRLVGEGPGWYRGWTLATPTPESQGPNRSTPTSPGEDGLQGIHLTYHESMSGNMTAKSLEFERGVRVATKTVPNWTDAFDAAAMDFVGLGESTLDCDRLRFMVDPRYIAANRPSPGVPAPWELEAGGGVVFKTRTERGLFNVTAARASYASAKELFTIDGAPGRPAVMQQTLPDGKPGPRVVGRGTINSRTLELQFEFESFDGGTIQKSPAK